VDSTPPHDTFDAPEAPSPPVVEAGDQSGSLRTRTARGTLVNGAFMVTMQSLGLLKGFVVAAFLTRSEYGLWGLLVISLGTLTWLKEVGIADKYVQQEDDDQRLAFQKAFTVDLLANLALFVLMLVALPLFVLIYGEGDLLLPGLVIAAVLPVQAFKSATWIFYREMRFARQRVLESIDPIVAFAVTVILAVAGLGYWSLVIGYVAGSVAVAIAALIASPYPPAVKYDRATMREYVSFSWPILVAAGSGMLIPQLSMIVGARELGLAGVGVIALAGTVGAYTDRIDQLITWTLYPAICRVKDRTELLFEAFVKSNRLALMWGVPFGVAMALFAPDLVHYGIGNQWEDGIPILQMFGLIAAANHIGFNWTAFYSALGNTRPIGLAGPVALGAFLVAVIPLTLTLGLTGYAIGMAVMAGANLVMRTHFLKKLFPRFSMIAYSARAIAPTIPAVGAVLLLRAAIPGRSLGSALAELALYVLVTAAATWLTERSLLREVVGYLRGRRGGLLAPA
jgi:PST family polysaccharide transporter